MSSNDFAFTQSSQLLDEIEGIDKFLISKRIQNMTEAFVKFTTGQAEEATTPNAHIPIYTAMGMNFINIIPFQLALVAGDEYRDGAKEILNELVAILEDDFVTSFENGLAVREELKDEAS